MATLSFIPFCHRSNPADRLRSPPFILAPLSRPSSASFLRLPCATLRIPYVPSRPAVIFHAEISTPDRGACRRLVLLLFRIETKLRLRSASRGSAALQSSLPSACCSSTLLKDERFLLIFSRTRGGRTFVKPRTPASSWPARAHSGYDVLQVSPFQRVRFSKTNEVLAAKDSSRFRTRRVDPGIVSGISKFCRAHRNSLLPSRAGISRGNAGSVCVSVSGIFMRSCSFYRKGSQFIVNVVRLQLF